jgi:hypothetical protein
MLLSLGAPIASSAPLSLLFPQGNAFEILGHSCGGIQEMSYATGFDPVSGYPTGVVHIETRCGGSGRGGGYHSTTYSAWVGVTWDFTGNVVSYSNLAIVPPVSSTFTATDANEDQLVNAGGRAYLAVPIPGAPTGVTALQTGDQFEVSWTPAPVIPEVIISSTIRATPVAASSPVSGKLRSSSAAHIVDPIAVSSTTRREKRPLVTPGRPTEPVLTATVNGSATTGLIGPLEPHTTYHVTVVSTTIGGSSFASAPVTVTTEVASIAPSAPTGVLARWGGQGPTTAALLVNWNAAVPGDSPIDVYLITISGSDGGGTFTQSVSGTTLAADFTVDSTPDWTVTIKAHNAAGWGAWSAQVTLGGL